MTPEVESMILSRYGNRGLRAIRGVQKNRIKKYQDLWVVVGDEEYVVINERFCTCSDYLYEISSRGEGPELCWHAIAVKIAMRTEAYSGFEEWYYKYLTEL